MDDYHPLKSYGPDLAEQYDKHQRGDEEATAAFLAEYAGADGSALEFAIGTGRIALALGRHGVRVDGIELSPDMVSGLREKPEGADLEVIVGDMATETTGRTYPLVYLVYNTVYNILGQDGQVECFRNAARHLDEGGVFVVEAAPPWQWIKGDQFVNVERITPGSVTLDVNQYDQVTQLLDENHVRIGAEGIRLAPISCRLIWPSEMDLMARLAGLRLVDRWGGWNGEPFTERSPMHVSVYGRA
ncbi:class I SAM-dependent methyltransferase [Nocardiopsis exhalans]|uniref:Class I SAM-dependent methyltransferase n=1 Tax=Nocardiopsis exhalans TaxID=163604 RepID=A0ABY5DC09_9ACTN|nr:class I SAM-dependent methyltransferase [Nocardiopsis exhalans]USY20555.1 class I SAM-dependent methyltransferase [Nocardiopsis exhalans]